MSNILWVLLFSSSQFLPFSSFCGCRRPPSPPLGRGGWHWWGWRYRILLPLSSGRSSVRRWRIGEGVIICPRYRKGRRVVPPASRDGGGGGARRRRKRRRMRSTPAATVTISHNSENCEYKKEGHNPSATITNRMGASDTNCFHYFMNQI